MSGTLVVENQQVDSRPGPPGVEWTGQEEGPSLEDPLQPISPCIRFV